MPHTLAEAAREMAAQLVTWRRHIHAHPELSGQEEQTARFVTAELRRIGYQPVERVGRTFGVTARLDAGSGEAVAVRADMDALPVTEETGVEFASRNPGVMHACGHDAHVAMLLGAAQLLAQQKGKLRHPVVLIFQPSEETSPGGALPMIEAGVLDGVARIFGLHVWSEMPLGTLGTRVGPFMSAVSNIEITVTGKGGHAAMPQQCIDPIIVAAETVLALQTAVSRSIAMTDNAVVSVTQVHAGTANNVLPGTAALGGTIRTLSEAVRSTVETRVREIAVGVAQAHGATAAVEIRRGYPALINDRLTVERALAAARSLGFPEDRLLTLPAQGGGEDFAYYAQKAPAAFLFLGARNDAKGCNHPHHHPRFNIDEDALPLGAALLAQFALHAGEAST